MDIFVIGDENTILGFSLIGIKGKIVDSVKEARSALEEAVNREDTKIILITDQWAGQMREKVDEMKMKNEPLVMDIPGPSKAEEKGRSLRALVEEAVGFKISKTSRG